MNDRNFGANTGNTFDPSSVLSGGLLDHNQNIVGEPLSSTPQAMPSFEDQFKAFLKEQSQGAGESEIGEDPSADGQPNTGFLAPTDFSIDQVVAHFPSLDTALETGARLFDTGSTLVEQSVESGSLLAKDKIQVLSDSARALLQDAVESWNDPDNSVHNALNHKLDETVEEVSELADSVGRSQWLARVKQRIDNTVDAASSFTERLSESLGYGVSNSDIAQEEAALESAQSRLAENLVDLTQDPDLETTLKTAFGAQVDVEEAGELIQGIAQGQRGPEIKVIDGEKLEGLGAFGDDKIFVSDEIIDDPEVLDRVILEEAGHYLDQELNDVDSPGDEGEIFARLAQDENLSTAEIQNIRDEDDHSTLVYSNDNISVENFGVPDFIEETFETVSKKVPKPLKVAAATAAVATNPIAATAAATYGASKLISSLGNDDSTYVAAIGEPEEKSYPDPPVAPKSPRIPDPLAAPDSSPVTSDRSTESPDPSPAISSASNQHDEQVKQTQQQLQDLGYDIDADGYSGPLTEAAIQEFQEDNGLEPDGIVGPLTQAALEETSNQHDEQVKQTQQQLQDLGYDIDADGYSGPLTEAKIKEFQENNGLEPDGIVGPLTQAALEEKGKTTEAVSPVEGIAENPVGNELPETEDGIAGESDVESQQLSNTGVPGQVSSNTSGAFGDGSRTASGSENTPIREGSENNKLSRPKRGNSFMEPGKEDGEVGTNSVFTEADEIVPVSSNLPSTTPNTINNEELSQSQKKNIEKAEDEISKLLHTDRQSSWTPWTDGDREVTILEGEEVLGILAQLSGKEAEVVLSNLTEEQQEKLEKVLDKEEYVESTGLGHAIASPFRAVGRVAKDTGDGIVDIFRAVGMFGLGYAYSENNGGSSPIMNDELVPFVEGGEAAYNFLAEADAPFLSNYVRCHEGNKSSCALLGLEIVLEVAGGPVAARVTSVIGRVGNKLIVRLFTSKGDEIVTGVSEELVENALRNADEAADDIDELVGKPKDSDLPSSSGEATGGTPRPNADEAADDIDELVGKPKDSDLPSSSGEATGGPPGSNPSSTGGLPNPKLRFTTDLDPDDVLRLEDLRKEVQEAVEALPKKPRQNFQSKLSGDFGNTRKTIGFADVKIDGQPPFEIPAYSGKANLDGFAKFSEEGTLKPSPNGQYHNRRSEPVADVEKKILEAILKTTDKDAKGSIRLVVNRLACSSCSDIIFDQFIKERPEIDVEVVQLLRP